MSLGSSYDELRRPTAEGAIVQSLSPGISLILDEVMTNERRRSWFPLLLGTVASLSTLIGQGAIAQSTVSPDTSTPPPFHAPDARGVDLASGQYMGVSHSISIGNQASGISAHVNGLKYTLPSSLTPEILQSYIVFGPNAAIVRAIPITQQTASGHLYTVSAVVGGKSYGFVCDTNVQCSEFGPEEDAIFSYDGVVKGYKVTLGDGTTALFPGAQFSDSQISAAFSSPNVSCSAVFVCLIGGVPGFISGSSITKPDSEILTYHYLSYANNIPVMISSSLGYNLVTNGFKVTTISNGTLKYYTPNGFTISNSSVEYCNVSDSGCSFQHTWPTILLSYTLISHTAMNLIAPTISISDSLGHSTAINNSYDNDDDILSTVVTDPNGGLTSLTYDTQYNLMNMGSNPCTSYYYSGGGTSTYYTYPYCPASHVATVQIAGRTWTYSYGYYWQGAPMVTPTGTNPSGYGLATKVVDPNGGVESSSTLTIGQVFSYTDQLGRTTTSDYNQSTPLALQYGTLNSQTLPSGKTISYINNGGVPRPVTITPPASSGASPLTITWKFPTSGCTPMTCHKPLAAIDPKGNETDYTYDPNHGGLLTETLPADVNGVRPQKRYSYSQLTPMVLNASGALVANPPVWRLTRVSECMTATPSNPASCVGSAQERVTTYAYNSNNLWLTSQTTAGGDGSSSQTIAYAYDDVGNITSVTDPKGNISYTTYDALRRKVFEISASPGGSNPRQIVHHVYDADSNEIRTEYGTGNATDGSDFTMTKFERKTYDPATGLLVKTEEVQP